MNALKDLVVKENKCDNGFRSGYLFPLENSLVTTFPGCDLKVEPHINSKNTYLEATICLSEEYA
ncbi:hypothetical protein ACS0TY_022384 [Phlomoides rotata]